MTAWTSGRLLPCDALATMLVRQVCSEPLISTSFVWSCSTGSASSGGRDDIDGSFRRDGRAIQPDIDAVREEGPGRRRPARALPGQHDPGVRSQTKPTNRQTAEVLKSDCCDKPAAQKDPKCLMILSWLDTESAYQRKEWAAW